MWFVNCFMSYIVCSLWTYITTYLRYSCLCHITLWTVCEPSWTVHKGLQTWWKLFAKYIQYSGTSNRGCPLSEVKLYCNGPVRITKLIILYTKEVKCTVSLIWRVDCLREVPCTVQYIGNRVSNALLYWITTHATVAIHNLLHNCSCLTHSICSDTRRSLIHPIEPGTYWSHWAQDHCALQETVMLRMFSSPTCQ